MWFDSHCHLQICEESESVDAIVERALAVGVAEMMTAGTDVASSERCVQLAGIDGVWAGVGVHPNSATEWNDDVATRIDELARGDGVVAIGESGLDFYRDDAPPAKQHEAFEAHIELAKAHDKALVIHTRSSIEAALDVLGKVGPPLRFVFHCWSGDPEDLARAVEQGAFISFAGNVSFKKSDDLRALIPLVPGDRLLVETDSPYLAPEPHRGRPNEPSYVVDVARAVASARGLTMEAVGELTTANARRLFALR